MAQPVVFFALKLSQVPVCCLIWAWVGFQVERLCSIGNWWDLNSLIPAKLLPTSLHGSHSQKSTPAVILACVQCPSGMGCIYMYLHTTRVYTRTAVLGILYKRYASCTVQNVIFPLQYYGQGICTFFCPVQIEWWLFTMSIACVCVGV